MPRRVIEEAAGLASITASGNAETPETPRWH
jgi:hypothetical protein